MAEAQFELEHFIPSFGQQAECRGFPFTCVQSLYVRVLGRARRLIAWQEQLSVETPCAGKELQASVTAECKDFCESQGLDSLLAKYLTKAKDVFSNIVNLSADIDYFMDDESEDERHIVLRLKVASDQKTAFAEYDRWVDWVISSIPVEQRGFFTLAVRRV